MASREYRVAGFDNNGTMLFERYFEDEQTAKKSATNFAKLYRFVSVFKKVGESYQEIMKFIL